MTREHNDKSDPLEETSGLGDNPFERLRTTVTETPSFDDGYEEPDRDIVQSGSFAEEHYEEEVTEDLFGDESAEADEPFEAEEPLAVDGPKGSALFKQPYGGGIEEDELPVPGGVTAGFAAANWQGEAETTHDWQVEEDYFEERGSENPPWPLGLIAIAVLALVLLIAGGYGVIQQRQATEDEIRQLRAELATTASPADIGASRDALQEAKTRNKALTLHITTLQKDNLRLADTVAGLEAQLDAQQSAPVLIKPATKPASPSATPTQPAALKPRPTATPITPAGLIGAWFVNFGSYGKQAVAQKWLDKLRPANGETVLVATQINGKTLYRVRVIGLSSKEAADQVARKFEAKYNLPTLWVGKQ